MGRNYRVRLKELCDRNNEALQYKTKELALHRRQDAAMFISRVVVGGQSFRYGRKAKRRKEAEENAAKIALKTLRIQKGIQSKHPISTSSILGALRKRKWTDNNGKGSGSGKKVARLESGISKITKTDVSLLHERCQALKLPLPEEVTVWQRKPKKGQLPLFKIRYIVAGKKYPPGMGGNKQAARERAAKLTLKEMEKRNVPKIVLGKTNSIFDRFASSSWCRFHHLLRHVPEPWRIEGSSKIIAAIIVQKSEKDMGEVVSLGTGNRCITRNHLSCDGKKINDSHAEVIVRRSFLRYLYHELKSFNDHNKTSIFEKRDPASYDSKLCLKAGVEFHLYISNAPCGDATVYIKNREMCGSNIRHNIGALRVKIENGEGAIPIKQNATDDKRLRTATCSDKILLWNVLGLQGALLSQVMEPVYLSSITIGTQYDEDHLHRAVCGRLNSTPHSTFSQSLPPPYRVNQPKLGQGRLKNETLREGIEKNKSHAFSLNWAIGDGDHVEITDGCTGMVSGKARASRISKFELFSDFERIVGRTSLNYNKAKLLSIDYVKCKGKLMKHLDRSGYGSWELIKKPRELQCFRSTSL